VFYWLSKNSKFTTSLFIIKYTFLGFILINLVIIAIVILINYNNKWRNRDKSLGCSYAVLGDNDAGKTVLLQCLTGILSLDDGNVKIEDDTTRTSGDVSPANTITLTERPDVGFSPQVWEKVLCKSIYFLKKNISYVISCVKSSLICRMNSVDS